MIGSRALLIYSSSKLDYKDIVEQASRNASITNVRIETRDSDQLSASDEERILSDIRSIPPQTRGQVRSGGGRGVLPISGGSKLNRSIPVLIVYDQNKPVDVYPKDLMGVKYDLNSAFQTPGATESLGIESSLTAILQSKPELLGPCLKLIHREFETSSGRIDLVFQDAEEVSLVVEVKEEADQATVGQVLKQSNGFKDKTGSKMVRKAIVALRTSGNVLAACKDAGVELYLLTAERQT